MAVTTRRLVRWVLLALIVFLVVGQFVPLNRHNPPSDPRLGLAAVASPPPAVAAALDRSCRDCHSNHTRWPWYSRLAPVSWLIVHDVHEGRSHLNFSEWAALDSRRRARRLEDVCEQITNGEMPIEIYVVLHPDARLSNEEVKAICEWTRQEAAGSSSASPGR